MWRRQRKLHQEAVHVGIAIELRDDRQHLGFAGRRRQSDLARRDSAGARAAALVAHVDLRRGVLTDEHDGQTRRPAAKLRDPLSNVGQDLFGELLAARDPSHEPLLAADPPEGLAGVLVLGSDFVSVFVSDFGAGVDSDLVSLLEPGLALP